MRALQEEEDNERVNKSATVRSEVTNASLGPDVYVVHLLYYDVVKYM